MENEEPISVPISTRDYIESYLKGKGTFAKEVSEDKWTISGIPQVYDDVVVMIGKSEVRFFCNKPAVEEFYADEFRRYQEKTEDGK